MNFELLISNLTNPAFLFFVLGLIAVRLKSDLAIPESSSRFIALYLLFSIGFKGGQELSHEEFSSEIAWSVVFAIVLSLFIPVYTFFLLKRRLNVYDAGAIAAAYGSVSAVTFVTAVSYLELQGMDFHGHTVAIMAIMEAPAIIAGLVLVSVYGQKGEGKIGRGVFHHAFLNGSVLLIIGSLFIGFFANAHQAEGIKPFTNDMFKGFLAIFLLDMGIKSGRNLHIFRKSGWFPILFALVIPLLNGIVVAFLSLLVTEDISNRFILSVLASSASYIAVPAAMNLALPKANSGLYVPMALAITFPVNITAGMPVYLFVCQTIK